MGPKDESSLGILLGGVRSRSSSILPAGTGRARAACFVRQGATFEAHPGCDRWLAHSQHAIGTWRRWRRGARRRRRFRTTEAVLVAASRGGGLGDARVAAVHPAWDQLTAWMVGPEVLYPAPMPPSTYNRWRLRKKKQGLYSSPRRPPRSKQLGSRPDHECARRCSHRKSSSMRRKPDRADRVWLARPKPDDRLAVGQRLA